MAVVSSQEMLSVPLLEIEQVGGNAHRHWQVTEGTQTTLQVPVAVSDEPLAADERSTSCQCCMRCIRVIRDWNYRTPSAGSLFFTTAARNASWFWGLVILVLFGSVITFFTSPIFAQWWIMTGNISTVLLPIVVFFRYPAVLASRLDIIELLVWFLYGVFTCVVYAVPLPLFANAWGGALSVASGCVAFSYFSALFEFIVHYHELRRFTRASAFSENCTAQEEGVLLSVIDPEQEFRNYMGSHEGNFNRLFQTMLVVPILEIMVFANTYFQDVAWGNKSSLPGDLIQFGAWTIVLLVSIRCLSKFGSLPMVFCKGTGPHSKTDILKLLEYESALSPMPVVFGITVFHTTLGRLYAAAAAPVVTLLVQQYIAFLQKK
jgi:hypothetical protein